MSKKVVAAVAVVTAGLIAGCGGSSSSVTPTTTAISGKVADGYLANAVVFMDKNGNYQLDQGEPSTVSDQQGNYSLQVSPQDIGKYPIVALAVGGQTTDPDLDTPEHKVAGSYMMSLPASAVSATSGAFVSPMSTLIREKMEAQPGLKLSDAMAEVRSQMNLPAGMNVMADYVKLGSTDSTDPNKAMYNMMHSTAQNMASLMAGAAPQVMGGPGTGTTVDVNRFRTMMGAMNVQLPQMVAAMQGGVRQNQALMTQMATNMANLIGTVPPTVSGMPFRNMSSFFPPMMGVKFWNLTGVVSIPTRNVGSGMGWTVPSQGSGMLYGNVSGSMGMMSR